MHFPFFTIIVDSREGLVRLKSSESDQWALMGLNLSLGSGPAFIRKNFVALFVAIFKRKISLSACKMLDLTNFGPLKVSHRNGHSHLTFGGELIMSLKAQHDTCLEMSGKDLLGMVQRVFASCHSPKETQPL